MIETSSNIVTVAMTHKERILEILEMLSIISWI